jgi:hypothetical protein
MAWWIFHEELDNSRKPTSASPSLADMVNNDKIPQMLF